MRKFALCAVLLLVGVPLFAGVLGLSVGATGGVELWKINIEDIELETETYLAIGLTVTFSPPFIPVGIRGGFEYAWQTEETPLADITYTEILILLGMEYSIAPPFSPLSFYAGMGPEISISGASAMGMSYSETHYGVLFYGGLNFSMGLIGIFAETGYGIIFYEEATHTHIPIRGGIKIGI